jgi:succinoglycan biosynthesis transport protein ExoP
MIKRLKRDINVQIVTTPILDPRTGREREVVDAFTVSYDNRRPEKAQKGAQWLVAAFLAEHRRQRQGRASNAAEFYAKEAERIKTHVAQLESTLADFKKENYGQLPELTQVNMSMMDRTEAQIAQNDMQARSLRQERVFIAAQLEQQRSQGPDAASVRQLEDQYNRMRSTYDESHPDMIALRRQIDSLKYGTSAGAGTSLRSQLNAKRSTLAEARQRYGAEYPDVKKLERDIATLEARIKSGERGDALRSMPSTASSRASTRKTRCCAPSSTVWKRASRRPPRWSASTRTRRAICPSRARSMSSCWRGRWMRR